MSMKLFLKLDVSNLCSTTHMQGRPSFTKPRHCGFAKDGLPCVCIVTLAMVGVSSAFPAKPKIALIDFSVW